MIKRLGLAACAILFSTIGCLAQSDKVIVVELNPKSKSDFGSCITTSFDGNKVEIPAGDEDPLLNLQNLIQQEEELVGPECFLPELKLIYKDFTYIVSLYCTQAEKFKNSGPYIPSNTKLENDLFLTGGTVDYLKEISIKHFGKAGNPKLSAEVLNLETLPDSFESEE